ncbi:unnamed protein product [Urochloa humidicola]
MPSATTRARRLEHQEEDGDTDAPPREMTRSKSRPRRGADLREDRDMVPPPPGTTTSRSRGRRSAQAADAVHVLAATPTGPRNREPTQLHLFTASARPPSLQQAQVCEHAGLDLVIRPDHEERS